MLGYKRLGEGRKKGGRGGGGEGKEGNKESIVEERKKQYRYW